MNTQNTQRFDAHVYVNGKLDYSSHGIDLRDRDLIAMQAEDGRCFVVIKYHQGATSYTVGNPAHDVDDECPYCERAKKMHAPCSCEPTP